MKRSYLYLLLLAATCISVFACNDPSSQQSTEETPATPKIKEENVTYRSDTTTLDGYVAYDESSDKKRPAVLVIPEWWGMVEYPKMRARQLAELGYIAMAVDMYGNGKVADSPSAAQNSAMPFYQNPQLAKSRIDAAMAKIKSYSQTDTNNIAAIGYCFGGGMVLNAARLGEPWKGAVSFHGTLIGTPANKDLLKAKILVLHGGDDKFVSQADVDKFKKQMDSIGASYDLKVYPGATHAFTNPKSDETAKKFNMPIAYNAAADTASWNEMKAFLEKVFK